MHAHTWTNVPDTRDAIHTAIDEDFLSFIEIREEIDVFDRSTSWHVDLCDALREVGVVTTSLTAARDYVRAVEDISRQLQRCVCCITTRGSPHVVTYVYHYDHWKFGPPMPDLPQQDNALTIAHSEKYQRFRVLVEPFAGYSTVGRDLDKKQMRIAEVYPNAFKHPNVAFWALGLIDVELHPTILPREGETAGIYVFCSPHCDPDALCEELRAREECKRIEEEMHLRAFCWTGTLEVQPDNPVATTTADVDE